MCPITPDVSSQYLLLCPRRRTLTLSTFFFLSQQQLLPFKSTARVALGAVPDGVCNLPCGTLPDVYARPVEKPTLRSYFARIDKMVSRMMTDSSFESEDNLSSFSSLPSHLAWTFRNKGKRKKKTIKSKSSAIFI